MLKLLLLLAANPYNVGAGEIGVSTTTGDLGKALANITQLIMGLLGGLAIVFLIYGGIQMAYSRGNSKSVETARETILYACVGLAVAIAGFAIVGFITGNIK
jgi:TRAP-type C4-dicarboxylate transport system permease small subunit